MSENFSSLSRIALFLPLLVLVSIECKRDTSRIISPDEITLWSTDLHIGPISDIKNIAETFGVYVIDESLSPQCHLTKTCRTNRLKVLWRRSAIRLYPCPECTRAKFYNAMSIDPIFLRMDAVVTMYASAIAELFMPFNKSIIVHFSIRMEIGRHSTNEMGTWVENVRRIAKSPYNFILANNRYDQEYVRYFTGITPVLVPTLCQYAAVNHVGTLHEFLVAPYRLNSINATILDELFSKTNVSGIPLVKMADKYGSGPGKKKYEFTDLAEYPAVIFIPYQVSVYAIIEFYAMHMPLFIPSLDLLCKWHREYDLLNERTLYGGSVRWFGVTWLNKTRESFLPKHPESTSLMPDPNNEFDDAAIREWVKLSDFYQMPHIILFNSIDELIHLLKTTDLQVVSRNMAEYMEGEKQRGMAQWRSIFDKIKEGRNTRLQVLPTDINDALQYTYGTQLNLSNCDMEQLNKLVRTPEDVEKLAEKRKKHHIPTMARISNSTQ